MHAYRIALALVIAGCGGKKDKPPEDKPATADAPVVAADATIAKAPPIDAAAPADAPIANTIAGKDPPTTESVHVEVGHAVRRWMANPRERTLYAKDFKGRSEPDGRVELVPIDDFLKQLPEKHQPTNPTMKTWLDPGASLEQGESRANVSVFYSGTDDYRELTYKREDGAQKLVKAQVNSRSKRDKFQPFRIHFALEASTLGKTMTARVRIEGGLAWLVLENDKAVQAVADLWPDEGNACAVAAPPDKALVRVRCTGAGDGQDFTVVQDKSSLYVRLTPANKDAPMSTDLEIKLAPGAKVTLAP